MTSIFLLIEKIKSTNSDTIFLKTKDFCQVFCAFLKCELDFELFQRNDVAHKQSISENTDSEKGN